MERGDIVLKGKEGANINNSPPIVVL